jgi:uncharacterized protein with HEPN domain
MGKPFTNPARIPAKDFSQAMIQHWETDLGNVSSSILDMLWGNMAVAFNDAIEDAAMVVSGESPTSRWRVLQPPTGTGKTQGACLFAAMRAKANRREHSNGSTVGILFVTRLIVDADAIATTINRLAGFTCAVAKHSQNRIGAPEMHKHDVLVITHQAYVAALDALVGSDDVDRWDHYVEWDGGYRLLTIIDESIDNIVDQYRAKSEDIRKVLSYLSPIDRETFVEEVTVLQALLADLEAIEMATERDPAKQSENRILWHGANDNRRVHLSCTNMSGLRDHMRRFQYDRIALHKDSPSDRQRIAQQVDETLRHIEGILSRFGYYARKGNYHTLNSSQFLLPADLPGPVVLDATAGTNVLWELLGERVFIQPIPSGARSYRNVTLHVARDTGVGKGQMRAKGEERIPRLLHHLEAPLADRSVLLVCHKAIEHHAVSYEPGFERYAVGHWGAIDGRNDWNDYDTAVIFGLPFRDNVWAFNTFFALRGVQDDEWLRQPTWQNHIDFHQEMQVMQLSASVIQAINRIRCRRVIDAEGNCPTADIYIVLPEGSQGEAILRNIHQEMPGVCVKPWNYKLDGPKADVRKASYHRPLVSFMTQRLPGETSIKEVVMELGLTRYDKLNLQSDLRDATSPLAQQLSEMGISYHSTGQGRGARSYLLKAA